MKKMMAVVLALTTTLGVMSGQKQELTASYGYYLPKVEVIIEVETEHTTYIPGPYSKYAMSYLGVKPLVNKAYEEWRIASVEVNTKTIPDVNQYFTIQSKLNESFGVQLSPEGYLIAAGDVCAFPKYDQKKSDEEYEAHEAMELNNEYAFVGAHTTLAMKLDSNYTNMKVNGKMQRVWDPIERLAPMAEKDRISAIVNGLYDVRAKKMELLSSGSQPSDKAFKKALKALEKMEEDYLALFIGKKITEKSVVTYTIDPQSLDNGKPRTLFRFSEEEGIMRKDNVKGIAYALRLTDILSPEGASLLTEGLAYRLPAAASLILLAGDKELLTKPLLVPQMGKVQRIPLDYLRKNGLAVELYPTTGAMKQVYKPMRVNEK